MFLDGFKLQSILSNPWIIDHGPCTIMNESLSDTPHMCVCLGQWTDDIAMDNVFNIVSKKELSHTMLFTGSVLRREVPLAFNRAII